jgi:hypothetical protein
LLLLLQDGGAGEGLGDAGGPFGGAVWWTLAPWLSAATVTGMATTSKLVDGLHAEAGEGEDGRERNAGILTCGQNDEPWKRYKYGDSGLRSE